MEQFPGYQEELPQGESKLSGNGLFTWLLLVALVVISAFVFLIYGGPRVKNDVPRLQPSIVKANAACDLTVKNYKPEFAPQGWKIYCVDSIPYHEIKGRNEPGVIYGLTFPNGKDRTIEVSRATPVQYLRHVIAHEWVHAFVAEKNLNDSPRWEQWKHYLEEQGNTLLENKNYEENPNEILADNVAAEYMGDGIINGVMHVDPDGMWRIFPELKPVTETSF